MYDFSPEIPHERLMRTPPALAFLPDGDYAAWRQAVDERLRAMIGLPEEYSPLDVRVEYEREHNAYCERRFVFTAEEGADVPCHLLTPTWCDGPFPVMLCLQGHSTGMHISLGRAQFDGDEECINGGRDFALQAVCEGYAALVLEQRCFGERGDARPNHTTPRNCLHASMVALLLGRTMIGERVWDIMRAIDALSHFPDLDLTRIGCMGNSGGGTTTYFAACLEPRITAVMPSCYVCTFRDSIARIDHCADNYLPGALRFFEMADLACLIAPRPLVVVAGSEDQIFPLPGVQEAFATIMQIYAAAGAPDRCRLVVGKGGHRFYPDDAWPVFRTMSGWGQREDKGMSTQRHRDTEALRG